jgi:lipopolysaccharide transport system ATP-binding protein
MRPAISVERLSKRYQIGAGVTYRTFRDTFSDAVRASRRWLRSRSRPGTAGVAPKTDMWALKDVSFQVRPGEVLGVIGRNGAGKSTLLKILSRITSPTEGGVDIRGRVGSLLEVGTGFHPELSGRENVFLNGAILGMSRREVTRKFDDIVDFAEIERFLDTPVKRYSSGMYTRLAFAVASHLETDVLVVDEVLAVGDAQFQKKCLGKMSQVSRHGRTVLFVSHNTTAIKTLCTRAVLFENGRLTADGDVDSVVDRYLTAGMDYGRTGIIPQDAPRYSDRPGQAYFRSVRLSDLRGQPVTQLYFGQPFQVHFACDVMKEIPEGHFEVSISTQDGLHVTYSTTMDGGAGPRRLTPGRHEWTATFDGLTLLPRQYTVDVGIHHCDGTTADFVQRSLDFSVLRIVESGTEHYPWPQTRGMVGVRAEWAGKNAS